jgi:hypothetical protein
MIYEETDNLGSGWIKGLYLALAAEGGGSMFGGQSLDPKGFIRITPTFNRQDLEYTYTASESFVELKTAKGNLRFAMDGEKVLRIEGRGIGLRFDGKLSFGGNAYRTVRGIEILQGGVYLIKALKGTAELDCHWDLKALKLTDPIVYFEPGEDGIFEAAAYDLDPTYEFPEIAADFEECIKASEKDFADFAAGLAQPVSGDKTFFDRCAYALWMSFFPFKGQELGATNKISEQKVYSFEQSIMTLPFKDATRALNILGSMLSFLTPLGLLPTWFGERQNLNEASPPIYAYAVKRLIDNESLTNVSKDQLTLFYDAMTKAVGWWLSYRTNEDGLSFYAYRHECGYACEPIFGCDTPAATPDLLAYLVLATEALTQIAAMLGKDDAVYWSEQNAKQLQHLTKTMRDKNRFNSVNVMTNASGPAEGILSCIPLILGKRLPDDIIDALCVEAKALPYETAAVVPSALVILGLWEAGKHEDAAEASNKLITSCMQGGVCDKRGQVLNAGAYFSPAASAALLTLASLQ